MRKNQGWNIKEILADWKMSLLEFKKNYMRPTKN